MLLKKVEIGIDELYLLPTTSARGKYERQGLYSFTLRAVVVRTLT